MAVNIKKVDYFNVTVEDHPGEAYKLLKLLAQLGINMHAFTVVPFSQDRTHLVVFPDDSNKMSDVSRKAGITLSGPQRALLVQGDDQLGALLGIHEKLFKANVNITASSAVSDGRGAFGYILYVRDDEFDRAVSALGL
jgi:predicted amino acid-binding ACT domain protein